MNEVKIYPLDFLANDGILWGVEFKSKISLKLKEILTSIGCKIFNENDNVYTTDDDNIKGIYKLLNNSSELSKLHIEMEYLDLFLDSSELKLERRPLDEACFKYPALKDFQRRAISKGISQNRVLYKMVMGSGKTFVSITTMNHRMKYNNVKRALILLPPESRGNFYKEIVKFSTYFKSSDIYIATPNDRDIFVNDKPVQIVTYRTLLALADEKYKRVHGKRSTKYRKFPLQEELEKWLGDSPGFLVIDESQMIANPGSRQSKMVKQIKALDKFEYIYELSGTPATKAVENYWHQFHILDPLAYRTSYSEFLTTIGVIDTTWSNYSTTIKQYYPDSVKKFLEDSRKYVFTVTDEELDLPPLHIKKIYVPQTRKLQELYQTFVILTLKKLKEDDNGVLTAHSIKQKFPYLQLMVDDPELLKDKVDKNGKVIKESSIDKTVNNLLYNLLKKWKFEDHPKLEIVDRLLDKHRDEKIIVWSNHPDTLDRLAKHYSKKKPLVIHGGNSDKKDEILDLFKTSKEHNLLFASSIVLKRAVNIIESTVSIYYNRSWSLEDWLQSRKRQHRLKQTKPVTIYPLILMRSLDEQLDRSLDNKDLLDKKLYGKNALNKYDIQRLFVGDYDDFSDNFIDF